MQRLATPPNITHFHPKFTMFSLNEVNIIAP